METPPIHVLLALDAQILGGKVGYGTSTPSSPVVSLNGHDDDDEDWSPESPALGRDGPATVADEGEGTTRTTTSRFWGVYWHEETKKWRAQYRDAADKKRTIGCFNDEEEAARAVNKAIRDAGLEGRRRMNAADATGALVPKAPGSHNRRDDSAVVAPDPARAPSATSSKFWGVSWNKESRRWEAGYRDANGKKRNLGYFDTQEDAAHAVNAAIRRAGLEGKRRTNPVVDGQLVPRARKASGHGKQSVRKRRRAEAAATPSTRPASTKES